MSRRTSTTAESGLPLLHHPPSPTGCKTARASRTYLCTVRDYLADMPITEMKQAEQRAGFTALQRDLIRKATVLSAVM